MEMQGHLPGFGLGGWGSYFCQPRNHFYSSCSCT